MKSELDVSTWKRKEHFEFFSNFEEPFFGLTVDLDCTTAYNKCKKEGISFFLFYLHLASKAVNSIENFRYRIVEGKVFIYDQINASATISRPDNTFGFSHIIHDEDFKVFLENAGKEMKRIQSGSGLMLEEVRQNEVHYSALPWVKFTSLSHSRSFSAEDSCPKISFGKLSLVDGKRMMPVSIHVHHALMDGYHVGLFVEKFQELLNS
ncbi:chloramphenicol acetyltransferase [Christiangramia echinicola]|uniref:Chloramphenicol O-acetyltransferase type A n=1 Tax=Christiangramia echinicola TaxID=279359 RepID=A0A1H1M2W4_9FLAO|nr:chloramphenicol acetyltransferase [Christiangramia echinicola]SDR80695.1 chloramphenicol O-acetyltransferase type A [Christiangramia echinicola]